MNSATLSPSRKSWADWLLAVIFVGFLWLPTLDVFTGIDLTGPPSENRLPAPPPRLAHLDFAGVQAYIGASEVYFNDHFGFRKRLIRWFQQWKTRLYRDQGVVTKRVVRGEHNWLFYGEQQMMEHYLGIAKFTPVQLKAWQTLLEKRRDWLAAHGIEYLVVFPPDKQSIYSEELPAWLQKAAPTNRETKLDQLEKYLREHSTVPILDLRQVLREGKTTAPTYLQNDSHWNAFGSFLGCQEIIKALTAKFPDLPPLQLADFNWTNAPFNGGDLARMLGTQPPEKNYFVFKPKLGVSAPVLRGAPPLELRWQSHNSNVISEISAPLKETVVVFHDSFGAGLRMFLGYSFKQVVFIWDNREFNTQIISQYQPQIVINEMVERNVNTQDPDEMIAKDALP